MRNRHVIRTLLGVAAVTLAIATGVSGQSSAPAPDPIVAEIRALRADLNQRLEANIRAQLMIARLQVQEQRINNVLRQLQDVQEKLHANETVRTSLEAGLKWFGDPKTMTAKEKEGADLIFGPLRAQAERLTKSDEELKLQQSDLMNQLSQEQSRWNAFNSRAAWAHIPAAVWGVAIEFGGWICPLTPLENRLRELAGESTFQGDFIARYLMPVMYPEGLTREAQIALGLTVLAFNTAIYVVAARRSRPARIRRT